MPGQQPTFAWRGNRNELLAGYVLSSIAAVTRVQRPDDYGLDLLCTLISQEGSAVRAGRAFGVQVKSPGVQTLQYGGLNRRDEWKRYEIDWLFGQDQPILVAVAHPTEFKVKLYTTFWIWYLLFQMGRSPGPGEIVLVPDEALEPQPVKTLSDGQWRYLETPIKLGANGEQAGDGRSYRIPMGKPIIELSGLDDDKRLNELVGVLDFWLEIEYLNIRLKNARVPYIIEIHGWETNQNPAKLLSTYQAWNPTPGYNIRELLRFISPAITSLMHNLYSQNDFETAKAILPIAELLENVGLLDGLGQSRLRELKSKGAAKPS